MSDIRFVLSDETVNSYGFVVDMSRLHLDRFKSNPVMLYNHGELVGKWKDIKLEEGILYATPVFMEGEGEALALQTKKRVEEGFIKGASLGISILSATKKNEEISVEAEVFECSVCDVPSNKNAIVLYNKEGQQLEGAQLNLELEKLKTKETNSNNKMEIQLSDIFYKNLGLATGASSSQIEEALLSLKESNDSLQKELDSIREEKINQLVSKGLSEGRFAPSKEEVFKKLATSDFALAKATIEALPMKKTLAGSEQRSSSSPSDRSNWTFDDWRKKDPKALLALKQENPAEYGRLLS